MGQEGSTQKLPYSSGFQVLRVKPDSPGAKAGLEGFFDIITEVNGVQMSSRNSPFLQLLRENENKAVSLRVYNSKSETLRDTHIVPMKWSHSTTELLGIGVRHCSLKDALDNVWHVLDVFPDSPATAAGLRANTDYILSSDTFYFCESSDFLQFVSENMGKPIVLRVYNSESDDIREVTIVPNKSWGGEGSLGCNMGYGLLHKIPTRKSSQPRSVEDSSPVSTPPIERITPTNSPTLSSNSPESNISSTPQTPPSPIKPIEIPSIDDRVKEMLAEIETKPVANESISAPSTPLPSVVPNVTPASTLTPKPDNNNLPKSPLPDLTALKDRQNALQAQMAALKNRMESS